jgi:DNA-directed RNA polymerase subunit RPC12/RpoP
MSEFKYACPVCGQHIKCDSSQTGTVMECPTCFQKITVPQAPATADSKLIITGTKVGERPILTASGDSGVATAPEKHFPLAAFAVIALLCAVVAAALAFRGKIFKSAGDQTGGQTNQVTTAPVKQEVPPPAPPKPVPELASVVFGKDDSLVLGSGTNEAEVNDPAKAAFLTAFKADLVHPLAFEGPADLLIFPGYDGAAQSAAGNIQWHSSFRGGLVIGVTLRGLAPNHKYVLTLNGNPRHVGNNHLMEQLARNNGERYYDFSTVTTDLTGSYHATFGVVLPAGQYDVFFFVKDTANWKIVLQHDFFQFTVE